MRRAICVLGFGAAAVDAADMASRASVVLTLLLTAVAFKLVISDSLPKALLFCCSPPASTRGEPLLFVLFFV